jgi:hypothetical protein
MTVLNWLVRLVQSCHVEKKIGLESIPVGDDRMERAKIHFPADCADERRLISIFYLRRSAKSAGNKVCHWQKKTGSEPVPVGDDKLNPEP